MLRPCADSCPPSLVLVMTKPVFTGLQYACPVFISAQSFGRLFQVLVIVKSNTQLLDQPSTAAFFLAMQDSFSYLGLMS